MGDAELLAALLEDTERLTEAEVEAFSDMQRRLPDFGGLLTPPQREWADRVADRLGVEQGALNLWSSGRVPRGAEVPTPAVLRSLPKRPPDRRA